MTMKVKVYTTGSNYYVGTVKKENKKSIIVEVTEIRNQNNKTFVHSYNEVAKFTYWKTTSNGDKVYRNNALGNIHM